MAKRKGWDLLSVNYRAKLTRAGITESAYTAGTPYPWRIKERKSREREDFVKEYTRYDRGGDSTWPDRVRDHLKELGDSRANDYMQHTRRMAELYANSEFDAAHRLWLMRDKDLPEYMHYYHGVFGY